MNAPYIVHLGKLAIFESGHSSRTKSGTAGSNPAGRTGSRAIRLETDVFTVIPDGVRWLDFVRHETENFTVILNGVRNELLMAGFRPSPGFCPERTVYGRTKSDMHQNVHIT